MPELFRRAEEEGKRVRVVMMSMPSDPKSIEACERAGVSTVLSTPPSAGLSRVELQMDAFEAALAEMRGE